MLYIFRIFIASEASPLVDVSKSCIIRIKNFWLVLGVCVCVCVCVYVCVRVCTCVCVYMCVWGGWGWVCMCGWGWVCMCGCYSHHLRHVVICNVIILFSHNIVQFVIRNDNCYNFTALTYCLAVYICKPHIIISVCTQAQCHIGLFSHDAVSLL